MAIRDKNDTTWQKLRDEIYERDKSKCRFLSILTPVEMIQFKQSGPRELNKIDPAHVFPVSTHPKMVYQADNIYCLNRTTHHRLDDYLSPLTGNECSKNRHFWWWWRIINKSTNKYNKTIDYEILVKQQLNAEH